MTQFLIVTFVCLNRQHSVDDDVLDDGTIRRAAIDFTSGPQTGCSSTAHYSRPPADLDETGPDPFGPFGYLHCVAGAVADAIGRTNHFRRSVLPEPF